VETHSLLLLNKDTGETRSLVYPQVALWDLISRGYAYDDVVRMLCAIAALQADEVEMLIAESLENWFDAGFLVRGNL
jgi:hypothetical protein